MHQKRLYRWLAAGAVILSLVAAVFTFACSSSPKSPSTTGSGDITVTSTATAGHTHQVTIAGTDIENPPPADKTIESTTNVGHSHTITLTPQDYQTIKSGGQVTVTSSDVNFHTHDFTISKG